MQIDQDCLSSQTVVSCARCKCSNRWMCSECRGYWIARRTSSSLRWLSESQGEYMFATLTIRTAEDWAKECEVLWGSWRKLGRLRSCDRRRRNSKTGLVQVMRGVAALHLVNKERGWQPHLHAVLCCDSALDIGMMERAWKSVGGGYADVERVRSLKACIRYAIAGELPADEQSRRKVSRLLHGVRVIRRIGS